MKVNERLSPSGEDGRLFGRHSECDRFDELLASARAGLSGVIVLRGGPGLGKSTLLEHAVGRATDMRILRAQGVESEMELPYAALHQLCAPLMALVSTLPAPQGEALATVFGVRTGLPPDRFLVGLSVLSLLSQAAEEQPLLCVVDDAQWLDASSAQVLGFVARRLLAEPIAFAFGARQTPEGLFGLPELELTGLRDVDARVLLDSVTRTRLDGHVRDQIVAETRGNPLALLELPRGLTTTELAGGFGLLQGGALPGRIEESFKRRIDGLSEGTRTLLLIAAAEPVGDPAIMWRAAERLGIELSAAIDDDTEDLLAINERVTFRHPLVRSAVYGAASSSERRAVHRALAEVTDKELDPDRRAWHLASAAAGPDEAVAAELGRSAERAQARGGLPAAAAFLQRAVTLTTDPALRADRALAAARASLHAADLESAGRFTEIASREAQDDSQEARALLMQGHIAFASGFNDDAIALLFQAARRLEPLDMALARETYLVAWGSAAVIAADQPSVEKISRAVVALPPMTGAPRPLDLVLDGCARLVMDGRAAAVPLLKAAAAAIAELPARDVLTWGWQASGVFAAIWDDALQRAVHGREVDVVRAAGALTELPIHLVSHAVTVIWTGEFAAAEVLVAEGDLAAAATGTQLAPSAGLILAALRGREPEAAPLIEAVIEQAGAAHQLMGVTYANWAAAILYNGLAKYGDAVRAARVCADIGDLWISVWALPEMVEAAARAGDEGAARAALARLEDATEPCGTDWALGVLARSRALLADEDRATELFAEAVERLSRTRLRPELARAYLLHGEWLRGSGQHVNARGPLRTAYDMFGSIGMEAFAERARRELVAAGETVVRRASRFTATDELTSQERQIALMVRSGLSNPEVGARLFLSPRTVEWHLRKVFAKLSITSRRQLREALKGFDWVPTDGAA